MTPTERKALALVNQTSNVEQHLFQRDTSSLHEALARLIDEHEAFKQDVSDAIRNVLPWTWPGKCISVSQRLRLVRFIIPAPDPITEWLHKSGYEGNATVEQAVRAYAQEQGE